VESSLAPEEVIYLEDFGRDIIVEIVLAQEKKRRKRSLGLMILLDTHNMHLSVLRRCKFTSLLTRYCLFLVEHCFWQFRSSFWPDMIFLVYFPDQKYTLAHPLSVIPGYNR